MKFAIAAPYLERDVVRLFLERNHKHTENHDEADIIVFTGGADINPKLYHHPAHKATHFSEKRDLEEQTIYKKYAGRKILVGICRGFQFLHVMNGGEIFQHVNNHSGGRHEVVYRGNTYITNSVHHQMINMYTGHAHVLAKASVATYYEDFEHIQRPIDIEHLDPEIAVFRRKQFGVQFHPEWCPDSAALFWEAFNRYLTDNEGVSV